MNSWSLVPIAVAVIAVISAAAAVFFALRDPALRKAFVSKLDPEAYVQQDAGSRLQAAKAGIYTAVSGLSIGQAIRLLNEVVREQIAGDPNLSPVKTQLVVDELAAIAAKLTTPDFIFLCSSAIDHTATNHLIKAERE